MTTEVYIAIQNEVGTPELTAVEIPHQGQVDTDNNRQTNTSATTGEMTESQRSYTLGFTRRLHFPGQGSPDAALLTAGNGLPRGKNLETHDRMSYTLSGDTATFTYDPAAEENAGFTNYVTGQPFSWIHSGARYTGHVASVASDNVFTATRQHGPEWPTATLTNETIRFHGPIWYPVKIRPATTLITRRPRESGDWDYEIYSDAYCTSQTRATEQGRITLQSSFSATKYQAFRDRAVVTASITAEGDLWRIEGRDVDGWRVGTEIAVSYGGSNYPATVTDISYGSIVVSGGLVAATDETVTITAGPAMNLSRPQFNVQVTPQQGAQDFTWREAFYETESEQTQYANNNRYHMHGEESYKTDQAEAEVTMSTTLGYNAAVFFKGLDFARENMFRSYLIETGGANLFFWYPAARITKGGRDNPESGQGLTTIDCTMEKHLADDNHPRFKKAVVIF